MRRAAKAGSAALAGAKGRGFGSGSEGSASKALRAPSLFSFLLFSLFRLRILIGRRCLLSYNSLLSSAFDPPSPSSLFLLLLHPHQWLFSSSQSVSEGDVLLYMLVLTACPPTDGKDKVRVFRVVRNADGTHDVAEWIVCALVEG